MKLSDIINFNPREILPKGTIAKKIAMEKLEPFTRDIPEFEQLEFKGGTKFRNGDTLIVLHQVLKMGRLLRQAY